jgi:uncharacterized Zn finger protein
MKLKEIKNEKDLKKNFKKAQTLLEPYIEMIYSFTDEESEEVDQRIAEWIFCASTVLAHDLNMDIEDVFPQNLAETMAEMGLINPEEISQMMQEQN